MSKETKSEDEDEDEEIVKLALPISSERDHTRGPTTALVTLIEYGDYECPYPAFQ